VDFDEFINLQGYGVEIHLIFYSFQQADRAKSLRYASFIGVVQAFKLSATHQRSRL
jgi:hypothetical protein